MNTDPSEPSAVTRDASVRAFRTLLQGLVVDLLGAVVAALAIAVAGGIEWSRAYWVALSLAIAKSALTALVSYAARVFVPPANAGGPS